jgi:hypothetical protein
LRKKYPVPESKSTIDSPVEQMQRIRQLIDEAERAEKWKQEERWGYGWNDPIDSSTNPGRKDPVLGNLEPVAEGRWDPSWIPDAETQTKIDAARAANPPPKSPWAPSPEVQAIIDAEKARANTPRSTSQWGAPKFGDPIDSSTNPGRKDSKFSSAATEPVKTPASNKPVATLLGGSGVAQEPIMNLDVRTPPAETPSSGVWSKIKNVPGVNATGKLVGRVAPGAGVALGALDVANRYQAGDTTGAAIAGATAAASSIPVIGTAAAILGTSVQALRDKIRTGKLFPNEEEILAAVAKDSEEKKDMAQLQKDLKDLQGYLNDRSIGPVTKIDIETAIGRINKILKQR